MPSPKCGIFSYARPRPLVDRGPTREGTMNRRQSGMLAAALVALTGIADVGTAQVAKPHFYVWSSGGRPYNAQGFVVAPDLKAMARDYNVQSLPDGSIATDPFETAKSVALEVHARTSSTGLDHIEASDVVFSFYTFGRDGFYATYRLGADGKPRHKYDNPALALLDPIGGMDCDTAAARAYSRIVVPDAVHPEDPTLDVQTTQDGAFVNSDLRFFREEDRLALPGNPGGLDQPFGFPSADGRSYQNPVVLSNANPSPDVAHLKKWMVSFCARYKAIQANPALVGLPSNAVLPDPTRFYLDNETGIAWEADNNALYMLSVLAGTAQWGVNDPNYPYNYWANPIHAVPGTGKTLEMLYEEAVTAFGLPNDLFNFISGLRPLESADSDNNRPFMLWYTDVCRRARDAVMKNCFYDVVPQYFPNCVTANYNDGRTDGVPGSTGYFVDSLGTSHFDAVNNREAYPDRDESTQLPRGWIGLNDRLAGKFWIEPSGKWDVYRTFCSGSMNSPVFYSDFVNETVFGGYGQDDQHLVPGARQPNLYLGPRMSGGTDHMQVLETKDETTFRLYRHILQSCINAFGSLHDRETAPWVNVAHQGDETPHYLRRLLMMLRAH